MTNSMRLGKCSKDTLMWSAFKHILTLLDFELHISHLSIWICGMKIDIFLWVKVVCLAGANAAMLSNLCEVQAPLFLWLPATNRFLFKEYVSPKFAYKKSDTNLIRVQICYLKIPQAFPERQFHQWQSAHLPPAMLVCDGICKSIQTHHTQKKVMYGLCSLYTHTLYITSQRIKHQTIKLYRHFDILLIQETHDPGPECVACRLKFRSSFHLSFILGQCTVKPGAVLD